VSADPAQALRVVPAGGDDVERRYAADDWRAGELGVPAARGRTAVSFAGIGQSWAAESRETLGSATTFRRLRLQHDLRRSDGAQTLLAFPGRG